MRDTLPIALDLMFGHEGGYSNHPSDPGGPTKYGVTHKTLAAYRGVPSVTAKQVQMLSKDEAVKVYQKSYWRQSGGDLLPKGLDYAVFDFGVNSGPSRAVKELQKLLGVGIDGDIGVVTLDAAKNYAGGVKKLIADYCDARMKFLRSLRTWPSFQRGWTIRVTGEDPMGQYAKQLGVIGNALRLVGDIAPTPEAVYPPDGKGVTTDRKVTDILKEPEAWAPIGGLVSAVAGIASGSGPVQWALGVVMLVGVAVGVYYVIKRARAD